MILYVNSCVRTESRTDRLARTLLNTLGDYEELKLSELNMTPLSEERLNARTKLIDEGRFEDPMFDLARQFAAADIIVIAAPFWDGSFPTILKMYVENIYAQGIVTKYSDEGIPVGLCKATKLYYVTTAGGPYMPTFGYEYLRALATQAFGIPRTELIFAENLDIVGNDAEAILKEAMERVVKGEKEIKSSELWDAYDVNFQKIEGITLTRGQDIPEGMFHLVSDIVVQHTDGTFLLMQRDPRKPYGSMWELSAGGSAQKGEDPLTCAIRELREESGIVAGDLRVLKKIAHVNHQTLFVEYLCITDVDKNSITLQEGENVAYKWVTKEELNAIETLAFEGGRDSIRELGLL